MTAKKKVEKGDLPKASIMIPTYNQAQMVGQAVESALAQTYPNLEVVVSDDASPDDTRQVIARYAEDPRVKYFRNNRNLGRVANYRRNLYKRVKGEWILNLDGDDFLTDPDFVADAIEVASSYDNIVMVAAGRQILRPDGTAVTRVPTDKLYSVVNGRDFLVDWFSSTVFPHFATLYSRRKALNIGFYEKDILGADWESFRKLSLHGDIILMGRSVGVWQVHGENASYSLDIEEHIANLQCILSPYSHAVELGLDSKKFRRWRDLALADYVRTRVGFFLTEGCLSEAKQLLNSIRGYPRACARAAASLLLAPKLWAKVILRQVGGRKLLEKVRKKVRSIKHKQASV